MQDRLLEDWKPTSETEPTLHLCLLGAFSLWVQGQEVRKLSRPVKWLLALLVLKRLGPLSREWLAETLWPETAQQRSAFYLRRSLTELRTVLGLERHRLTSPTRTTLHFDFTAAFCDVLAFDSVLAHGDPVSLRQAVGLYRGPLLPDCDADWAMTERAAREQAYLTALEAVAEQAIQSGKAHEAVRCLRQAIQVDAFRETSQRALMEALASQGDKAGMTLVYRQLRLRLHDEMQTEPSAETKARYQQLQERLQEHVSPQGVRQDTMASAPLKPSTPPLRIPFPVSELVGRKEAIQNVATLLSTHRLVTLTGSGGVGKTRLALSIAVQVGPAFSDGVWFVDLSPLTDPTQVVATVAHALEIREQKGQSAPIDALREYLTRRRLLLVLDNAEHLLESCAVLVATLLESLPELRVLVTSRQVLGVAGEQVWRVPSLAFPESSTTSVPDTLLDYAGPRLFVTRALSASSAFVLTAKNAPAIVQICARLDGIPLALELAAARIGSLSAEQIAARLEDAFRLLTMGARTALPRHQTLRAMVDWSYDLLSESEKILLSRLSVFVGGWTLEAAESVCGFTPLQAAELLDVLTNLMHKSLVLAEEAGGTMRYRMLETLRQYGARKLDASGETADVRRRLRDYFFLLAEEAQPHLRRSEQAQWFSVLTVEHDNLRLALAFCLEDEAGGEAGLRLGVALRQFWWTRGHWSEGRERLTALLSHSGAQVHTRARADALHGVGVLASEQGDYNSARALFEESLGIHREVGDKNGIALTLNDLGILAFDQGDYTSAQALYKESLALRRESGDRHGIACTLIDLGLVAREQGDYVSARALFEKSLAIFRELGDKNGIAASLNNQGSVALLSGDYAKARSLYEESLILRREVGNKNGIASTLTCQGNAAFDQGDYVSALARYDESLAIFRELGDKSGIAYSLNSQGNVARDQEDYASARPLYEEGLGIFREFGDRNGIAYSLSSLGMVAFEQGDYVSARCLYRESLSIYGELGDKNRIAYCLEAFASLAAKEDHGEQSVRLWGASFALREALRTSLSRRNQERREFSLATVRASLGEVEFAAAWEAGRAMTWEQAAAYALDKLVPNEAVFIEAKMSR